MKNLYIQFLFLVNAVTIFSMQPLLLSQLSKERSDIIRALDVLSPTKEETAEDAYVDKMMACVSTFYKDDEEEARLITGLKRSYELLKKYKLEQETKENIESFLQ
jgi:hypothetical protein